MLVVGGGVIGTEIACIFAAMNVEVTLVEGRDQLLGFIDREIIEAFQTAIRRLGVTLRLGEKVQKVEEVTGRRGESLVQTTLESGKELRAETLLYAVGRQGVCRNLNLEKIGIAYDDRERLKVNEHYQTTLPPRLRRGRRNWISRTGGDGHGTGPACSFTCVWSAHTIASELAAVWHLCDSGNLDGR